jgi:hypothetical protein
MALPTAVVDQPEVVVADPYPPTTHRPAPSHLYLLLPCPLHSTGVGAGEKGEQYTRSGGGAGEGKIFDTSSGGGGRGGEGVCCFEEVWEGAELYTC